ncbi:MAG: hypothetical protein R6U26_01440 [Candidatus Undinarchaeales archaeon]
MANKKLKKKKDTAADIGKDAPTNLKFGIIIAVAIFWAEFLRSIMNSLFRFALKGASPIVSNFIVAASATFIGYIVLISYKRVRYKLKKIRLRRKR